ncbi:fungal-specific transcription factor domain-containing protein [Cercophora scortea]|uniref:Fungal-specific transcription factor domain-containing protein n=1 Tax=Cercophora scortea TaxID=314031 RepID=A0AAE0ING6_9PEZI|nr:fungal-specific transcription factor domain-containing protein [Cercophora scortea]
MATHQPQHGSTSTTTTASTPTSANYKRASRKGAPRRFGCEFPGCDKLYSRAEHLQRHQLNHVPREIFRCDVEGCEQKFVRADLLARHRKRHSSSYIPRNRVPSFSTNRDESSPPGSTSAVVSPTAGIESRPSFASVPHDAAILLTTDSNTRPTPLLPNPGLSRMAHTHTPNQWGPQMPPDIAACNIIRQKPGGYYQREGPRIPEPPNVVPFHSVEFQQDEMHRDNFAVWLFNPQGTYAEFSVSQLPFVDGGLESTLSNTIHYDYESLTSSRSQLETPPRGFVESDELISDFRRQEILRWFQMFRSKQPKSEPLIVNLVHENGGDFPALNLQMMQDCMQEFWDHVSPRLPIVHQPTFACNRCSLLLLIVMIALGAASLCNRDSSGNLSDYGGFADVLILGVRWEILTAEEASPPVSLWVAQALLLLEFYEKMYSSRKLHERAHIYHSVALTLLRRGSPLIGRSGSESPPEMASAEHPHGVGLDARTWWSRWAETEAMHRVVFAAFMMDIVHAAMFGHTADMAPSEIRLPLPCDDNLWTASNPEHVRQLDQNFRMYGVKPISFLDGLKRAMHGKEVKTHSFGRMIIMSGLLSVGWHLSHRERHLKWLDLTTPSMETQDQWKKILLKAFDDWKGSFDIAQGSIGSPSLADSTTQRSGSNGPIQSAAVLYHLAQISLHVDIVDCQVYAGAKRLLGRKVSVRDYTNVVARMKGWATLPSTRHAVLHAFKLLHRVLVEPRRSTVDRKRHEPSGVILPPMEYIYSCRNEPDPHRPWIMYYAALAIWSFVRAVSRHDSLQDPSVHSNIPSRLVKPVSFNSNRVVDYLSSIARLNELDEATSVRLGDGLSDLLDCLHAIFDNAQSELLQEAHERLRMCKEMLPHTPG